MCGGDLDLPIKISVYDFESSGKHVLMGEVETTVNSLTKNDSFSLNRKGKETGRIVVTKAEVSGIEDVTKSMSDFNISAAPPTPVPTSGHPSFVDYISGGKLKITFRIEIFESQNNGLIFSLR